MTLKTIFTALGIGLATIAVPAPAFAKDAPVYTGTFNNTAVSATTPSQSLWRAVPRRAAGERPAPAPCARRG
jgi:hypothetical protein